MDYGYAWYLILWVGMTYYDKRPKVISQAYILKNNIPT